MVAGNSDSVAGGRGSKEITNMMKNSTCFFFYERESLLIGSRVVKCMNYGRNSNDDMNK